MKGNVELNCSKEQFFEIMSKKVLISNSQQNENREITYMNSRFIGKIDKNNFKYYHHKVFPPSLMYVMKGHIETNALGKNIISYSINKSKYVIGSIFGILIPLIMFFCFLIANESLWILFILIPIILFNTYICFLDKSNRKISIDLLEQIVRECEEDNI